MTHNSEFVEMLYPHHSGSTAEIINDNRPRVFLEDRTAPFEVVSQERVTFVEQQAYAQMAACMAARDVQFCRYAGPDEAAQIRDDQELFSMPQGDESDYRYIVPDSDVSMTIIPLENNYGAYMRIADYSNNWAVTRMACNPGCGCNPEFDG